MTADRIGDPTQPAPSRQKLKSARLPPRAWVPSLAAADDRLGAIEFRVLIALCARVNRGSKLCNPSIERIAADVRCSTRHVYRARSHLRKLGYIDWHRESAGRGPTCRYEILWPDGQKQDDPTPDNDARKVTHSVTLDDAPVLAANRTTRVTKSERRVTSDVKKRVTAGVRQTPKVNTEKEKNIATKQSPSLGSDGPHLDSQFHCHQVNDIDNKHQWLVVTEKEIKKNGPTKDQLAALKALVEDADLSDDFEVKGHAQRVYEDALILAGVEDDWLP